MGKFYTDDQIKEVIAALENHSPGIFARMQRMVLITDLLNDEQERELTANSDVLAAVLPLMPFVLQAEDRNEALTQLTIDLSNAVRTAAASAQDSQTKNPTSGKY